MSSQELRFKTAAVLIATCVAALGCGDAGAGEIPADGADSGGAVAGDGVSSVVQPGAAGVGNVAAAGRGGSATAPSSAGSLAGVAGGAAPLAGHASSVVAGAGGSAVMAAAGAGGRGVAGSGAAGSAGTAAHTAAGAGGSRAGAQAGSAGSAGRGHAGGPPTFDEIYALITDSCNGCHGLGQGGLMTKTRDVAYQGLVNAAAHACRGWKRVVPNEPEQSVLYLAITRTSMGGCDPDDMPPGGTKWSQENIDLVKAWIEAGAPDN